MKCNACTENAIWLAPALCKEHFIESFEKRVKETIEQYELIPSGAKICVAASGGKDSLTTLFILKKLGYDISALVIDEGIANYREHTIIDLEKFCKKYGISLEIASFKKHANKELDVILEIKQKTKALANKNKTITSKEIKRNPCTVCGTFRRYLLNKHAKGFDILATGHNADDEAQVILMNLLRAQTSILPRTGPKTGNTKKEFVQRIKPLYFCTEKEVMTYTLLQGFKTGFTECPYVKESYRAQVRDLLNDYAQKYPGVQRRILSHFLQLKIRLSEQIMNIHSSSPIKCKECGEPTRGELCSNCKLLIEIR